MHFLAPTGLLLKQAFLSVKYFIVKLLLYRPKVHFFIRVNWKMHLPSKILKWAAHLRAGCTEMCGLFEEILKVDGFSKLLLQKMDFYMA